jgi:hypothetical protein
VAVAVAAPPAKTQKAPGPAKSTQRSLALTGDTKQRLVWGGGGLFLGLLVGVIIGYALGGGDSPAPPKKAASPTKTAHKTTNSGPEKTTSIASRKAAPSPGKDTGEEKNRSHTLSMDKNNSATKAKDQ